MGHECEIEELAQITANIKIVDCTDLALLVSPGCSIRELKAKVPDSLLLASELAYCD